MTLGTNPLTRMKGKTDTSRAGITLLMSARCTMSDTSSCASWDGVTSPQSGWSMTGARSLPLALPVDCDAALLKRVRLAQVQLNDRGTQSAAECAALHGGRQG
eukprot:COSAG02_NODE_6096_length_3802_cov_8.071294_2_plen_103_part_00